MPCFFWLSKLRVWSFKHCACAHLTCDVILFYPHAPDKPGYTYQKSVGLNFNKILTVRF